MQALYQLALDPIQETAADLNSYGFRKGRCCQDAMEQLFKVLSKRYSARWILEGDIKGCFDHISHDWLMKNVSMDKAVLKQFLKAGFVFRERLFPNEEGTPQGGVISPTLANIALNGLERLIRKQFGINSKVNVVRYADDFVVTAPTEEGAREAESTVRKFLAERGLELSAEKTKITQIGEGFDFLGWNFRKYKEKLLIKPSKASLASVKGRIKDIVLTRGKALSQDDIIDGLNPVLRGWTNYHRSSVAKKTFVYLEWYVFAVLMTWAVHRHDNKSKRWIADRYWHRKGTRKWVFRTKDRELIDVPSIEIIRHTKVKSTMNPYTDTEYFEKRRISGKGTKLERGFRDKSIAM